MSALPLIGLGAWAASTVFDSTGTLTATRGLGLPISPTVTCEGAPCQVFERGAVEARGRGRAAYAPLGARLIGVQATRALSGTLPLTYKQLYALHSRRMPMPAGFRGGTRPVRGGTFVPYSPTLAPASGYVVTAPFWQYINDPRIAPGSWLHDIGLPLTPAVQTQSERGQTKLAQAFQRAVLLYDAGSGQADISVAPAVVSRPAAISAEA